MCRILWEQPSLSWAIRLLIQQIFPDHLLYHPHSFYPLWQKESWENKDAEFIEKDVEDLTKEFYKDGK